VRADGLLDTGSVVAAVDEAAGEAVVVTGALPPQGHDLDLLVSEEQARRLAQVLAARGFLPRGRKVAPRRSASRQWVLIEGCSALAVDLNPVRRWGLPAGEQRALVADAVPIEGFRHLVRPSAHHMILIMARRLATGGLPAGRLGKLAAAIGADPLAWERAEQRAGAWGAQAALLALRRMHEGGPPPTRSERARALAEVTRAAGVGGVAARAGGKLAAAMPQRARVVGLSGLDGSGKSSQVRALTSLLEQLDVAVVAEWKPLGHNASIRATRRVIKRAYARLRGLDSSQLDQMKRPGRSLIAGANPALLGGRQNPLLTHVWATVVCLASAGHYRMVALRHAGSGRLIIFDRFALDTTAQLRFFYGPDHGFAVQRALIRMLCPAPIAAWLLEVPGEVALARKPEQYDLSQLKQQESLLHQEAGRLGVTCLDGTRPMAELTQHIATQIWERMSR
jgi:thymidylate kinase